MAIVQIIDPETGIPSGGGIDPSTGERVDASESQVLVEVGGEAHGGWHYKLSDDGVEAVTPGSVGCDDGAWTRYKLTDTAGALGVSSDAGGVSL